MDFISYGSTYLLTLNTLAVDILAGTVLAAITGAIVAWTLGLGATK
jgi:hypothetical protein